MEFVYDARTVPTALRTNGTYRWYLKRKLVYVGSSRNIRERLTSHLAYVNTPTNGYPITPYRADPYLIARVDYYSTIGQAIDREDKLIHEYHPALNRMCGLCDHYTHILNGSPMRRRQTDQASVRLVDVGKIIDDAV